MALSEKQILLAMEEKENISKLLERAKTKGYIVGTNDFYHYVDYSIDGLVVRDHKNEFHEIFLGDKKSTILVKSNDKDEIRLIRHGLGHKCHREDGKPALFQFDRDNNPVIVDYYLDDIKYSEEEFEKTMMAKAVLNNGINEKIRTEISRSTGQLCENVLLQDKSRGIEIAG